MITFAIVVVIFSIVLPIAMTCIMRENSDYFMTRVGQREDRAINRLLGMLLIVIAVQFVINDMKIAFPLPGGGT